jgi:uncharacterized membrane protein YccC
LLAIRVTTAALVALALAKAFHLLLPLWSVLTAVIVTQVSVGRSLKTTFDYFLGTLSGALYGGAIGVLLPANDEIMLLVDLALAVAPLALIAAINPRLTAAPITGIIVVLVPTITHVSPYASAFDRVLEVALGGFTGFIVSFFLLPSNAHRLIATAAAAALSQMARALDTLLAGLQHGLDVDALHRIQDGIGEAMVRLNVLGTDAEDERSARLTGGPNTGPLLRTLLRLRHDLVMIGRVGIEPLPESLRERLAPRLAVAGKAIAEYLRASAAALSARRGPPSLDDVAEANEAYAAEVAVLRREGMTRSLSGDEVERVFAVGFAIEQMHNNLKDLGRCVSEWAETPQAAVADKKR